MNEPDVPGLFLHFLLLGSMAIGGTNTVMPDMYRYVVDLHHWITGRQFTDVYALAQAAPGPNVLYVTLVGMQVAGWKGAVATTFGLFLPATMFSFMAVALGARNPRAPIGRALLRALAPIAVGFVLSGGWVLVRSVSHGWQGYLVTLASLALVLRTRVNPLYLIVCGALAGIGGFV